MNNNQRFLVCFVNLFINSLEIWKKTAKED